MYEVLVSDEFIETVKDIPLQYTNTLTKSFISIRKVNIPKRESTFLEDLLEQIRNQEKE